MIRWTLLAVLTLAASTAAAQDAYEPDNVYTSATVLVDGVPQESHSISPANDVDWFTFTLTGPHTVTLETSGPSGDTRMWLYESDGSTLIEFDDDDGAGAFSMILTSLTTGTYTVKVDEYGNDSVIVDYSILLTLSAPASPDAYEPDDAYTNATVITAGVPQNNHSICPMDDVDWVTFALTEPQFVVLETSGASGNTRLSLYESDGTTLIEYDRNSGVGNFSMIAMTLTTGTYTAKIEESGNDAFITNYSISLAISPPVFADAYEPDDAHTNATTITAGVPQNNHSIYPVGDVDWVTFRLTEPRFVILETSGASGDTIMWLYESDGTTLIDYDNDSGVGRFSRLVVSLPAGVYTASVKPMSLYSAIADYSISLDTFPATSPDAYEPDDVVTSASTIAAGTPQQHSIYPVGDVDWVTFSFSEMRSVVIETTGTMNADTELRLYRADGATLVSSNDDGGEGYFSKIDTVLGAGTYTLTVTESSSNADIREYWLSLQTESPPAVDIYEPDDIPTSASFIAANTTQTAHSILPIADEDWATFTLPERSHVLLGTAASTGDTSMWLYEADGTTEIEYDDLDGPSLRSFISRTLDAGTYLVRVGEYGNNYLIEDYSIFLVVAEAPEPLASFGLGYLLCADYSPSTSTAQVATVCPGRILTWDPDTGSMTGSLRIPNDMPLCAAYSPDGTRIAVGSETRSGLDTVDVWDLSGASLVRRFEIGGGSPLDVTFSPDARRLLVCRGDGKASLHDLDTGATTRTLTGHSGLVLAGTFSPDGSRVATASDDGTVRVWNVTSGTTTLIFSDHTAGVTCVAFSPDGTMVASGSNDKTVLVWNAGSGVVSKTYTDHNDSVRAVEFSPDGALLLSADAEGKALVRSLATDFVVTEQTDHTDAIHTARFSPDGLRVLTAAADQNAYVWEALSGTKISSLAGHSDAIHGVAISRDNSQVFTAGADGRVTIWDAETTDMMKSLRAHTGGVTAIALSPDGSQFATGGVDGLARIWNAATTNVERVLIGHTDVIRSVAFSPDGNTVATAGDDLTARLWDVSSGAPIRTFVGHTGAVQAVGFSPDGTRVVTASLDDTARVWDAATSASLMVLNTSYNTYCAAYSPDGQWIVTGSDFGICRRWDATTGDLLDSDYLYPGAGLSALAFLHNGNMVTAGEDGYALLGDVPGAWTTRAFGQHVGSVRAVAVSRYGTRVVTGGDYGIAYLWDTGLTPPACLREPQAMMIQSDGQFWAMAFDYTTSQMLDSLSATSAGTLNYSLSAEHWIGAYIYDYASGAYARGFYVLRQSMTP